MDGLFAFAWADYLRCLLITFDWFSFGFVVDMWVLVVLFGCFVLVLLVLCCVLFALLLFYVLSLIDCCWVLLVLLGCLVCYFECFSCQSLIDGFLGVVLCLVGC